MLQKTKNHQNQGSIDKKWFSWFSPQVTYPDGFTKCKKTQAKNSHAGAPLKKDLVRKTNYLERLYIH
jgi:hypothetical protein